MILVFLSTTNFQPLLLSERTISLPKVLYFVIRDFLKYSRYILDICTGTPILRLRKSYCKRSQRYGKQAINTAPVYKWRL